MSKSDLECLLQYAKDTDRLDEPIESVINAWDNELREQYDSWLMDLALERQEELSYG